MSRHNDEISIRHMLDHSHEVLDLTKDKRRTDLDSDRVLELALVRLLEIIGEAAGRVSAERRKMLPDIPWSQIISMRNRLIHGYDSVDMDILWEIISSDIPSLVEILEKET